MDRVLLAAPTAGDIEYIAANLRAADVQELLAVYGPEVDLLHCLRLAVAASDDAYVAVSAAGEPVALTGVSPLSLLGGLGSPWLLGTEASVRYPRDIVAHGHRLVRQWERKYSHLFNYVDARNLRSIAWLKRIGFTVLPAQPYGQAGLPFHRFERRCT